MCDADEPFNITWLGWVTSWDTLRRNGWVITRKEGFNDWRQPEHSSASSPRIYIRHKAMGMIGRLTPSEQPNDAATWELDYLTHERNRLVKPVRVVEYELQEPDIGELLTAALAIQAKRPRRRPEKGVGKRDIPECHEDSAQIVNWEQVVTY